MLVQAYGFELDGNDVVRRPCDEPKGRSSATLRLTTSRSGRPVRGR
jgi:hypothetical protein